MTNGGAPREIKKASSNFLRAKNIKFLMIPQEAESSTRVSCF